MHAYSRCPPDDCAVLARLYGPRPSMPASAWEAWGENAPLVGWLRGTWSLRRSERGAVLVEIHELRCRAHAAYLKELRP